MEVPRCVIESVEQSVLDVTAQLDRKESEVRSYIKLLANAQAQVEECRLELSQYQKFLTDNTPDAEEPKA